MRLDLFLKKTRLVRQRQLAKALCDGGAVHVNEKRAKPSQTVRPGDRIRLQLARRDLEVRVLALPQGNIPRHAAPDMVEILRDTPADRVRRVFADLEAWESDG